MVEGWNENDYFILFTDAEVADASTRYRVEESLSGFPVVGLQSWDDLIVRDDEGQTFRVPTVPLSREHLAPTSIPSGQLQSDTRLNGRIKWYVKPVIFGGAPDDDSNIVWIPHERHGQLVCWWNEKYRDVVNAKE
jgi:hypothetical protein